MGLVEIAYLITHDKKTAENLVRLMQVLGHDALTFNQLVDKMEIKPN